jgi:hypothetical protein
LKTHEFGQKAGIFICNILAIVFLLGRRGLIIPKSPMFPMSFVPGLLVWGQLRVLAGRWGVSKSQNGLEVGRDFECSINLTIIEKYLTAA